MAISFNNIPDTQRTPGVFTEVDNSRALQGLYPNPHKALILAQKVVGEGSIPLNTLVQIVNDGLADGYFGAGSLLARMINKFKENNPNTELYAMALSGGTTQASAIINWSAALSFAGGAVSTNNEIVNMMINGKKVNLTLTSNWSGEDIGSGFETLINNDSTLGVIATRPSGVGDSAHLHLSAVCSGTQGNYMDVRFNYYTGQSFPTCFDSVSTLDLVTTVFQGGAGAPDLGDAWAVIETQQFQYIVQPYVDADNLTEIENELADRFKPLEDLAGIGFTAVRGTQGSCTTLGNLRNSPHNVIIGAYDSPTPPEIWAAALGAVAADKLNNDPARPLHYLELKNILLPPSQNIFTKAERNTLLYDGIATWLESTGKVVLERCITTYQTNAAGIPDPSYLDVQTLATLEEIRYQYKARMVSRFLVPRFKLADNTFPVQPGSYVVTPSIIRQEIIALFTILRDDGLIENLDDFITNLVVERDSADRNRVNVLLPPDLINQFRTLASLLQFIL